ncbi:MAG TPA: hypothetical protein VFX92_06370 [Candidatus Krumholzibacteria bacterium]|nr:hypothetical protein [Candidatus Krumholzibacteria bacterium]
MLPDFPAIHRELMNLVNQRVRARVHSADPFLATVGRSAQHEGDTRAYRTVEGGRRQMDYKDLGVDFTITHEELKDLSVAEIMEKFDKVAEEMAGNLARMMYSTVSRVSEEAGTAVDGCGKPFSFDLFLEALERLEIDFDEGSGKPKMPALVVSPELGAHIRKEMPAWEQKEDCKRRFTELMERKRKDWHDREGNRKLVD